MADLIQAHLPIFLFIVLLASWLGTGAVLYVARRRKILAHPNERSSHAIPTPTGGGLAVIVISIMAWHLISNNAGTPYHFAALIVATVGIAAMSFVDDLRSLPITIRLAVQIFAVTYVLQATPASVVYFGGFLPPVWDLLFAGILWLWFINLFNFMDGIDGIAGVETISIGCGISGVVLLAGLSPALGWLSLIFISATIGFLWWNWHPAKIFLGDVGSIPLGFIFGWLLLMLAAEGQWPAAVILSLYYLTDATLTLLSRALRGQKIWQAHKKHFYQRAVQRGLSHAHVSTVVLIGNAGLIFCAMFSVIYQPWLPLLGAAVITALLLAYLKFQRPKAAGDAS
ncbi:MAG: glycosyltransferase family 4 protein [Rhodospirillaceae bacterium]|jgi:UDP-N-acetylmuramyl pentapeptide phosphotransferase/UDP-N-acetylglucosamine-1-phosphate transferase